MGNPISITLKPGETDNVNTGFNTIQVKNDSTTTKGNISIVFSNGSEVGKTINAGRSITINNQQMLAFKATNEGQTNLFLKVSVS